MKIFRNFVCLVFLMNALVLPSAVGCASNKAISAVKSRWSKLTAKTANENRNEPQEIVWQWNPLVPRNAKRGEILGLSIPRPAVAHFIKPNLSNSQIRLVSAEETIDSPISISNINGRFVRNYSEVLAVLSDLENSNEPVQVDLSIAGDPDGHAIRLAKHEIAALLQSTNEDVELIRFAEGQSNWIQLRDGSVSCKLTARTDRDHNLIHLVAAIQNCWGMPKTLPVEIELFSAGKPLQCLTVCESLELLYGDVEHLDKSGSYQPFSVVSEAEGYLLPENYRRLERNSKANCRTPTLVNVSGRTYPGPPILADARALTGLLMRRQIYHPNEVERVGWLLFHSQNPIQDEIELVIDLGNGPRKVSFSIL